MYLKSIEVQGFKSFAQKILFEFHNGITGIVGPNGSGKSNVADAVRWVLGEQSARQLRGGNMQDVIFSGTENRRPLSYASVAITLDNNDHKLPVSFDEVTVARRLYRSGESEYLINGSSCRLKDIQELFYDTGIGKEGYSIIGQGQIDRILSGKPEERRELFDEAAGIVKFKRRKNTALKKLEDEKQNLLRVTDILTELSRQLGPLEKQSEKARLYLARKEELKKADICLFLAQSEEMKGQLEELEGKRRLTEENMEEISRQLETAGREYESLEAAMENLDSQAEQARKKTQENALRRQQLEGQINVLKEQVHTGKSNEEQNRRRLADVEDGLASRGEELEKYAEKRETLQEARAEIDREKLQRQDTLDDLNETIGTYSREIEDGKNEIIEILNKRANTKGKMQRFDTMMEQVEIRKADLNQKALRLKSEEEELQKSLEEAQEACTQVTGRAEQLALENRQTQEKIQNLTGKIQEQSKIQEQQQAAYHRDASRLESLRNLAERYEGYGNSIRRVMEKRKDIPGIQGVVADLIQVEKNYETAIETALGGSIQNVVTDTEQTAKKLIQYLKEKRFGRATFLPLTSISSRGGIQPESVLKEPGVIGPASGLVKSDSRYQGLVQYLLGRVLVVDQMDHAIAIGKKYRHSLRMVTLEGESFSPGGSMTGGAYKNNSNLLGRRREIEELENLVHKNRERLENLQAQLKEWRSSREQLRELAVRLQKDLQETSLQQNTLQMNLSQQKEKEEEIQKRYQRLDRERVEIGEQVCELEESMSSIQKELEQSGQEEKELEVFIKERQKELEQLQKEQQEHQKEVEEIHLQESALQQKAEFLNTDMQRIRQEKKKLQQELDEIQDSLHTGVQEISQKEEKISCLQEEMDEADNLAQEGEARMKELLKEREEVADRHKEFFQKREELSKQMNLLDKEGFRLNSQIDKLEETQEARIGYMWEEYEMTPGNAAKSVSEEENRTPGELKKDIARVREEIRKLGDVNVNAIEDYKELQERHTFLSAQHEDLVTAEKTLLQIIEDLDTGMRKQFAEKFKEIQREFNKAFQDLFGGGKGTLELMEDADILEAGIKIISQPPGKKLQNMMQLSGGEKALTAIALLFAIQNLKPSPFCLLDEIEAALDDSNVVRFAQYVHKLTKNTQFIIITHRRGTMNAADRLYGITMQEKGVSTLVSVDLVQSDLQ